ncbi:MAG: hypothetical protein DHS20C11_05030 [Lysobacteraceae bacterium]|nr:MAG: hypothetical protein DHS20C11_05030 [Xanthomonadaceae bacterium]
MSAAYQLAQLNVAKLLAPLESPQLADFVNNLDRINALAEASDGFVWRLKDEDDNATALRPFDDDMIVNMSVWRDLEALKTFVFAPEHVAIMRRKREWFHRLSEAYMVLWWVPAGHQPTTDEARSKLEHIQAHGPTAAAFNFRTNFAMPVSRAKTTSI